MGGDQKTTEEILQRSQDAAAQLSTISSRLERLAEQLTAEVKRATVAEKVDVFAAGTVGTVTVIADLSGQITHVENPHLLGFRREDLVGKAVAVVVPSRYRAAHTAGMKRFARTGVTQILDTPLNVAALQGDGRERIARLVVSLEGDRFIGRLTLGNLVSEANGGGDG